MGIRKVCLSQHQTVCKRKWGFSSDLEKEGMLVGVLKFKLMSLTSSSFGFPAVFLVTGVKKSSCLFHGVLQGNYQGFAERGC